ncbi:solute carrier family 9 member A2, partial [Chelydra serpentina]
YFNSKYLQKFLLREYEQPKSSIVLLYEKLERKHAIELVEAGQLIHEPSHTSLLDSHRSAVMVKESDSLNPDVLENIQKILARNLYKIRRTVPAYNRHTLPGESGTAEEAKEIL